jgi:glucose/arabinose dehydrogenase
MIRRVLASVAARIGLPLFALTVIPGASVCHADECPPGRISTVAGTGFLGTAGDGGPATEARLGYPCAVAIAADGGLYIADENVGVVREVDARTGIITRVGGNYRRGYSGDGGPATEAQLSRPVGLAVGQDGSLYIADSRVHRIRKVDPNGIITAVAGDGWRGEHGVGRYGGDGGPAIQASLNLPWGIAVGADGTLYIADTRNQRIRKVDAHGVINTIAGDGYNYLGRIGRFAGDGGPATEASLKDPYDVAVGPDGSVYIADASNSRIRKVNPAGVITTIAGSGKIGGYGDGGPATEAGFSTPGRIAFGPDGSLYVSDSTDSRVCRIDPAGIIKTIAGNGKVGYAGDGGPATEASFRQPLGIAVDAQGSIYIADRENHRIRKVCAPAPSQP